MKFLLICLSTTLYLFSAITFAAETKIYRWVDENGKMHFSDTAVPGTEEISVKHNNLLSEPKPSVDSMADELSLSTQDDDKPVITYQATITSPQDDQAIRSNEGTIDILVSTEPEKESTHKLQLYLDGKVLGSPQISPAIRALNIDRGTHQLQVYLLDEKDKVLAKTQVLTVHLQRTAGK